MNAWVLSGAALASFLTAAVAAGWLARWLLRRGVLDVPGARSSHSTPTPRGGGIAVLCGAAVGVGGMHLLTGGTTPGLPLLAAVGLIALAGLADDVQGLSPWVRLLVQTASAVLVMWQGLLLEKLPLPAPLDLPVGPLAPLLTWLWLVGVTNLFNFLDGIDGYAGWQATLGSAGAIFLGLGPAMSAAAAAMGGAAAGFLLRNWHPARIFLGDVGSTALGFFLAVCPLAAPAELRPQAVFTMAMLLWFFLSDGAYTLLKRLVQGERIWTPHRSHLYQQLARKLGRHDSVVERVGAAGTLLGATALGAYLTHDARWQWAVMGAAVAGFLAYRRLVERGQSLHAAAERHAG